MVQPDVATDEGATAKAKKLAIKKKHPMANN